VLYRISRLSAERRRVHLPPRRHPPPHTRPPEQIGNTCVHGRNSESFYGRDPGIRYFTTRFSIKYLVKNGYGVKKSISIYIYIYILLRYEKTDIIENEIWSYVINTFFHLEFIYIF